MPVLDALSRALPWLAPFADELAGRLQHNGAPVPPSPAFAAARRTASTTVVERGADDWHATSRELDLIAQRYGASTEALAAVAEAGTIDLAGAEFSHAVDMAGWSIPGDLVLERAVFHRDLWLMGATVGGAIRARGAQWRDGLTLENAEIAGSADFADTSILGRSEMRSIRFHGPAPFTAAHFGADVWFRGSDFRQGADFTDARFAGEAGLGVCTFGGDTTFANARFADNAGFDGAVFLGQARFDGCHFARNTWFTGAVFTQHPKFDLARFAGKLHIDPALMPPVASPVHAQLDALARGLRSRG